MNYYEAPQISESHLNIQDCIFLAGSISNARNWQKDILKVEYKGLTILDLFHVFNPRRANYNTLDANLEYEQISWEFEHIHYADNILFWFSSETVAPITLFEYGSALHTHKPENIFVGCDPEYMRRRDVIIQTALRNLPNFNPICNSIEELAKRVIDSKL